MITAEQQSEMPDSPITRRRALKAGLLAALSMLAGPDMAADAHNVADDAPRDENPLVDPRIRLAHLLRRAGFGASKAELDRFEAMGFEATVDHLLDYEAVPDPIEEHLVSLGLDLAKPDHLKRWWLVRMAHTTRPLQEKMVFFWHSILTSSLQKVGSPKLMLQQNEFFRGHALDNFQDILLGISKDPAMLFWLDGRSNRKQHPNENYARELMELFTMGEGHYTEQDVRAAARAFTGWTADKEGNVSFRRQLYDPGQKTFLSHTGNFKGDDIVRILVEQRATAEYISKRLFSFFAYRDPAPEIVQSLADTYLSSGFSIRALVREILLSEAFSSARAYRSAVKSPVDLVVSSFRLLGIATDGQGLTGPLRLMGQDIFAPPNVAGWPGGAAWLNSSTWIQRVNFGNLLANRRSRVANASLDLQALVHDQGISRPEELVQYFIDHLLDGNLSPEARQALDGYLFSNKPLMLTPSSLNQKGRDLVYLLMASPEYQLT